MTPSSRPAAPPGTLSSAPRNASPQSPPENGQNRSAIKAVGITPVEHPLNLRRPPYAAACRPDAALVQRLRDGVRARDAGRLELSDDREEIAGTRGRLRAAHGRADGGTVL